MSVRDRLENKPQTQEEIEQYTAGERTLKPFSGAGSMDQRCAIGRKDNQPDTVRGRMNHAERAEFAAANADPVVTQPLTAEQIAWAAKTAKDAAEFDRYNEYLCEAVKQGKPVEWAWAQTFGDSVPCALLKDVPRSANKEDFDNENVGVAARCLRDAEMFAAYKSSGENPRTDLMYKVFKQLLAFIHTNMLNATSEQAWLRAFLLLRNYKLLPTPLPTQEQLNNAPADDGEPVAFHDDMVTPVTYVVRGKLVRYSQQMLDALTSAGFETVMKFNRVGGKYGTADPQVRRALEFEAAQKITRDVASDGNPVCIMDGQPFIVNGKKYSNQMIDKLSGEDYRKLIRLPRGNSKSGAMQQ
jgi:hypothetical protein